MVFNWENWDSEGEGQKRVFALNKRSDANEYVWYMCVYGMNDL